MSNFINSISNMEILNGKHYDFNLSFYNSNGVPILSYILAGLTTATIVFVSLTDFPKSTNSAINNNKISFFPGINLMPQPVDSMPLPSSTPDTNYEPEDNDYDEEDDDEDEPEQEPEPEPEPQEAIEVEPEPESDIEPNEIRKGGSSKMKKRKSNKRRTNKRKHTKKRQTNV